MGELTMTTFLSLDGVMQAPGGPSEDPSGGFSHGGWLVPHADVDMGAIVVELFSKAGAFLLGRTTYDIFAAHWPKVADPSDPIATGLNALPKYVASRTRRSFDWRSTSLVRDVVGEIAALKERTRDELQVHGSCGLAQTLIQHDLIDEYRLLTFPVLLGQGKRLFAGRLAPATLQLVRTGTTSKGVTLSVYRRGPAFTAGSFALEHDRA